ncbi:MAG TPA: DNA polymerase I, partial [Dehalococcoidia bacterium]|nr:DNA polymerase I [Dehalococcoidia bacterium]
MLASPDEPRLLLLDGHGIIHRAYHAFKEPLVVRRTGEVATAVFGFANTLLKALEDLRPTHIAVALDAPGPTFRHERDEAYKAHREAMPSDLRSQLARVRELIEAFNIPMFELPGWEADDIIGSLARQAAESGMPVYIATLDSDLIQLVRSGVFVYMYRPYQRDAVLYDAERAEERYGIPPEAMPDLKGLKGDASDNIPGVPGIGEKTACKLLQQFGSLDGIYARIDEVTPEKLRQKLIEYRDVAMHSRDMATIDVNTPVALDLEACRVHEFDRGRVLDLFRELEFRSLMSRLPDYEGMAPLEAVTAQQPEAPGTVCHVVRNIEELERLADDLRQAGCFAFRAEATHHLAMQASLVGIALASREREAYYIPLGHAAMHLGETQLPLAEVARVLGPLFADPAIEKIGHNVKFDMLVLERIGMPTDGVRFDTMIAAHLLGETTLELNTLAYERLGVDMPAMSALLGTGRRQLSLADVSADELSPYACTNADVTLRLREGFGRRLEELQLRPLFADIEMPLVPVLGRMERTGIAVDTAVLRDMSGQLAKQLAELERRIYEEVGHEFMLGSPQQLSDVLYTELGLPKPRKTQRGYTTDAATLEKLRPYHPVIDLLLEHRQYGKIKSTYVDALPGMIHPETGRVHTTFSQTTAATGRLASSDPNLQNIPVRTELGRQVRRAFVARDVGPDPVLLAADYSQIELRILAHLSGDPGLIAAFVNGEDIHRATAARMYSVAPADVTPDMRRIAKVVNFGVVYGLSEFGLTQRTELSREEAATIIGAYFEKYPGIRSYIEQTIDSTRERGYAET